MATNGALLFVRPDEQTGLAFGAGNLNESDFRFFGHLAKRKGTDVRRVVGKKITKIVSGRAISHPAE